MRIAVITGSAGLIGAEAVRFFSDQGHQVRTRHFRAPTADGDYTMAIIVARPD